MSAHKFSRKEVVVEGMGRTAISIIPSRKRAENDKTPRNLLQSRRRSHVHGTDTAQGRRAPPGGDTEAHMHELQYTPALPEHVLTGVKGKVSPGTLEDQIPASRGASRAAAPGRRACGSGRGRPHGHPLPHSFHPPALSTRIKAMLSRVRVALG